MPYLRRREVLSGIALWAGSPLLGAFCKNMTEEALGQPLTRKRVFFYVMTLGMGGDTYAASHLMPEDFIPTGNPDGSVNLGSGWAPLEPYRKEMIFLRDTYSPFNASGHGNLWFLTCAQMPGITKAQFESKEVSKPPAGISIDRLIAKEIGKNDLHPSIHLSVTTSGGAPFGCGSADGPDQRFPSMYDPVAAYAKLFAAGLPIAGDAASTAAYLGKRRSLFDFTRADIGRLNARLAAPERAKMDQYIESIRTIENRLVALADPAKRPSCTKPAEPRPRTPTRIVGGVDVSASTKENADAMLDMSVAALACGLTKVAVLSYDCPALDWLGDVFIGTHGMQHGSFEGYGRQASLSIGEMHKRTYNWHAGNVATIRKRLGETREGDGALSDNTLIAPLNSDGTWHHGGATLGYQYAWLIGSCGGYFKTNRFKRYPRNTQSMSDVFVSIANAVGVPITRFGDQTMPDNSLLSGLPNYPAGPVNKGPVADLT